MVIPTLNAGHRWQACLAGVAKQTLSLQRRLVVDSASTDDTVSLAEHAGFEVKRIRRSEFNHGGTRQWAAEYLDNCDILVFLTQDAILESSESLMNIARCFNDPRVAVAYGRQFPHQGAKPMEAHARQFNYGDTDQRKDLAACAALGAKVFFCSNSFAAYRRSLLLRLGGFRKDLILGEDMEFAARAVKAGFVNVYSASATASHSHDYSLLEQFRRYFDIGVFDARNKWMREDFGSHRGEGLRFVKSELRYLRTAAPLQIPRAMLHTGAKLLGHQLGLREESVPLWAKKRMSMSRGYWG